jgi:hypothetical protein
MKDAQPLRRPKKNNIKMDSKEKEERGFIWHRMGSIGGLL